MNNSPSKIIISENFLLEFLSLKQNTPLYHGRSGNRPYSKDSTYIYLTPDLGYAAGFSNRKEVYEYQLNIPIEQIFSYTNPKHRLKLENVLGKQMMRYLNLNPNEEIDWAELANISTEEHELPEDVLINLGFKGILLKERTDIYSILLFDEKDAKFIKKIDITTPKMQKYIQTWYEIFTKDKNFL